MAGADHGAGRRLLMAVPGALTTSAEFWQWPPGQPLARRQRTHLVALVRAGATFTNGKLIERPGEKVQSEAA